MDMVDSKAFLPAWTYEEKICPIPYIACSSSFGVIFLMLGSLLTAMFRKIPWATDIAMCGVAFIVLGLVLILGSICLGLFILITKQTLPKLSSAAKAEVPPDPFSLVPVYPRPQSRDARCSSQVLLLPGAVDPVVYNSILGT